ncbi:hypothetical protein GW17_00035669, partial [Ensete ventricosum]
VQNLIEHCLQLYMNRGEVVRTLSNRARIEPGFTTLVNSMPLGYPVLQQPEMTTTGQPHFDPRICGFIVINDPKPEATPAATPCGAISSISEMAASPASMTSNNHFPFTPSEISGMGLDASTLETTLTSDVASMEELQLGQDCAIGSSRDSLGSVGPLWNFSITDLAADLANLGVEEYFAEAITAPSSQPHDEKS